MTGPGGPVRLTVERELVLPGSATPERVQLTRELPPSEDGRVEPERVGRELAALRELLEEAIRSAHLGSAAPRERGIAELLETYRPRQGELVELLREDGEITEGEYGRLRAHLAGAAPGEGVSPGPESEALPAPRPLADRPIAAAPLEGDRTPSRARPLEELLRAFEITSLKQAGAVRARRQISYDEYMLLKRHFARPAESPAT
jgi:hypothetical protein